MSQNIVSFPQTPSQSANSAPIPQVVAVAPFEADIIESTNQKRLICAREATKKLAMLRPEINRLDHQIAELSGELKRARTEFKNLGEPEYHPLMNPNWFKFMVIVASLLEMPLNALSLDFLRLPELESYMLAAFFAIINVWFSKFSARVLRQATRKDYRDWILFVIANAGFLSLIYKLGMLRGLLAESAMGQTIEGSASVFIIMQFAFYLAGMVVAFNQYPPSKATEQLIEKIKSLRIRLHSVWIKRRTLAKKFNVVFDSTKFKIEEFERACLAGIYEYRDFNQIRRKSAPPKYWKTLIENTVFYPVNLGQAVDPDPDRINEVLLSDMDVGNDNALAKQNI